jgi:hypothetical protein
VLVPIIIAGAIKLPQEELVKLITADLFGARIPLPQRGSTGSTICSRCRLLPSA